MRLYFLLTLLSFGPSAIAADPPAACYTFLISAGPYTSPMLAPANQKWCYQRIASRPGSKYIFNVDDGIVKPELAMIADPDGTVTHGSLVDGEVTAHRVRAKQYNPYPVPTEEPFRPRTSGIPFNDSFARSLRNTLTFLLDAPARVEMLTVREGHFEASVKTLPWRGYWWPMKGATLVRPLIKYDTFVSAREGANPGASAWERGHHNYSGGDWWIGHCNGWAASSILRKEPSRLVHDPVSKTNFTVTEQKGLLAEADYCVKYVFFGGIGADSFHKTLTYYIGGLGKGVAMDHSPTEVVDNNVVSKYAMDVKRTGPHTFVVAATLTIHKYEMRRAQVSDEPGTAVSFKQTYRYSLTEDERGNVVAGSWISGAPDFLWVPLSPAEGCGNNNPRLKGKYLNEILNL